MVQNAVFGNHAAACHVANQSYFRNSVVTWDEATSTIKSWTQCGRDVGAPSYRRLLAIGRD